MAYRKENMIKQCLEVIEKYKLIWITEVSTFVPFSQSTLYARKLEESEDIKKALEDNRIKIKISLRKIWYDGGNPTLQLALYKLLATKEEFERINVQKLDHTTKGESIKPIEINVSSQENAKELKDFLQDASKLN